MRKLGRIIGAALVLALAVPGIAVAAPHDPLLAAAGDIACAAGQTLSSVECNQLATARLIARVRPNAVAALGDNQYEHGALSDYLGAGAFNTTWGMFKSRIHPVPGNDDYGTPGAAGYFGYFGAAAGSPLRGYYSYNLGSWHLLALNSNCTDAGCGDLATGGVSTAEVDWLRSDLARVRGRCILAYWHHPLFASTIMLGNEGGVRPLWSVLYEAHADVVLNAHAHNYERFAPQEPYGHPTSAGVRQFIVGTGGKSFFSFVRPFVATSRFRDNEHFGVLFLNLHRASYDWRFAVPGGGVVDKGHSHCHVWKGRR